MKLSDFDKTNCQTLERIFHDPWVNQNDLADIFASPVYSDDCKRYFAKAHAYNGAVLLLGDRFLTEEIIFSHISNPEQDQLLSGKYLNNLLVSSHLSERIMEVIFQSVLPRGSRRVLELTPDIMITPRVINSWIVGVSYGDQRLLPQSFISYAACIVKRVHPEYEGFPDEWALKVFCGN